MIELLTFFSVWGFFEFGRWWLYRSAGVGRENARLRDRRQNVLERVVIPPGHSARFVRRKSDGQIVLIVSESALGLELPEDLEPLQPEHWGNA